MKRIELKPGQESVWDYPRPPKPERTDKHLKIIFNGEIIAETNRAFRFLKPSHSPVYYVSPEMEVGLQRILLDHLRAARELGAGDLTDFGRTLRRVNGSKNSGEN